MKNGTLKKAESAIQRNPFRWVAVISVAFAVLSFGFDRGCISKVIAAPVKHGAHMENFKDHKAHCKGMHDGFAGSIKDLDGRLDIQGKAFHEMDVEITEIKGDVRWLTRDMGQVVTLLGGVPYAPPPPTP